MGTETLKSMKDKLMNCVQNQLVNIQKVDAKQLGEAIDMIKDLSEAIYYCTITASMEKSDQQQRMSYYNVRMPAPYDGDGRMYYGGDRSRNVNYYPSTAPSYKRMYSEPQMMMDQRNDDAYSQFKELESYLQDISSDINNIANSASPEQKAALRQKISMLMSKI